MLLYADEDFSRLTVAIRRCLGHAVITAQQDGRTATPDPIVLARAHALGRAVLTFNRRHGESHSGILSATHDSDFQALAVRIDAALTGHTVGRWCIRVNRLP